MLASRRSFASAFFSALVGVAAACDRPAPRDGGTTPPTPPSASAGSAVTGAASARPVESDPYVAADPTSAKSIGHTSYVLALTLDGGHKAVFKPRSKLPLGDRRYKGEIAAYRLAKALGLDNVPRAIPRSFDAAKIRAVRTDFDEHGLVDDDGRVRGALMPWIEQYSVLPLEEGTWRARWEPWLYDVHATVPDNQRALASSISTMIVFDYVTANWDRWSGGNVAEDGATGKVLFVDNDGAFYEWPAPATLARQLSMVERLTRFSRRFVDALRAMNERALHAALGEESPGSPLLPERAIAGVEERRKKALSAIDARSSDAGDPATYAFE